MLEEGLKIQGFRLVKEVRAAETKMVIKAILEVKRKGLTKTTSNALSVTGLVFLQDSAMQTRRNLKEMKPRLQDKSLMKRINAWS